MVQKNEYYICKAMPCTSIDGAFMAYQDLVMVDSVSASGIRFSVYTGALRGSSRTVASEAEFLQKFMPITADQYKTTKAAQLQNMVQPCYYLKVVPNSLNVDGVSMRQGDVVMVSKMVPDPTFNSVVSCKISFEVVSGESKGKKFTYNSLPHFSVLDDFAYLGDAINDGGKSKVVTKAIEDSDAAYQAANPSAAASAASAPAPSGEKKNNFVIPAIIAAALIAGGIWWYCSD